MNTAINATATAASTFTKVIWASMKETFVKKVQHLNKILAKHGKAPITVSFENPRIIPVSFTLHTKGDAFRNDREETRFVEVLDAVCSGYTLVQKDDRPYTYLGTVSVVDGIRQVFCKDDAFAPYFTDLFRPNFCDHCHSTRTNRKTYHLFHDPIENKVLQIGSTCAKEFFGIDSTAFLDAWGKTFLVDYDGGEDDLRDFSRGCIGFSYEEVLPALSYATRGFVKWQKKDSGFFPELPLQDQPTSYAVSLLLNSSPSSDPIPDQSNNCSLLSYDEVLSYWSTKYEKESSTFAFNCLSAVKAGYATSRTLGSFCYAVFAAFNNKVRSIREAEAAKNTVVVPCPFPVNSRATIEGIVTNIRETTFDNFHSYDYSEYTAYIVDFTADNGTLYHFTTSAQSFSSVHTNDRISLRATIGETKPFKSIPYTRLSRPVATVLSSRTSA